MSGYGGFRERMGVAGARVLFEFCELGGDWRRIQFLGQAGKKCCKAFNTLARLVSAWNTGAYVLWMYW